MKCFGTFRVRPGAGLDRYIEWVRRVNVPAVRQFASVRNCRVWRTCGASDGEAPFDVVEEMEITDRAAFEAELDTYPGVSAMEFYRSLIRCG